MDITNGDTWEYVMIDPLNMPPKNAGEQVGGGGGGGTSRRRRRRRKSSDSRSQPSLP